jgi:hypothetical protein
MSVRARDVFGDASVEFSTVIEADRGIVADRTMTWDASGYGSHAERGVASPLETWYFAEGVTHPGFSTFFLLQNPGATAADVEVTFLRPAPLAPVVRTYVVAAHSRYTVWTNRIPGLEDTEVSAVVRSTNGVGIVAERAVYLDSPGRVFNAGHAGAGAEAPALTWWFAEGSTGTFFDEFLLVSNPNGTASEIEVTYQLPSGTVVTRHYSVAARSRFTVWVDQESAALRDTAVSVTLHVTNGVPVVAERAMWWPGPTAGTWSESHDTMGSTETGVLWAVADGEVGGPSQQETYLLVANASAAAGAVRVTLHFDDGTSEVRVFALAANGRLTVSAADSFPSSAGRRFSATVQSVGISPVPVVVERAMYSSTPGQRWSAGTAILADRVR